MVVLFWWAIFVSWACCSGGTMVLILRGRIRH